MRAESKVNHMTVEEQLKQEILKQYKSVRAFTTEIGIPYTTLHSVFTRGIANAGIETMLKVFDALGLDIESVPTGTLRKKKNEKSPSAEESAPGDQVTLEESNRLLMALGYIQEGDDLSDQDLAFLSHIVGLLDAWFRSKGQ